MSKIFRGSKLNQEFIDRAKIQVSFNVEDADLTKAVVEEAKKYPGQEQKVVEFYKNNPAMMNNLRGIALEEKVMNFVVNSCKKTEKKCTIEELFKSDFLKEENSQISKNKKGEVK